MSQYSLQISTSRIQMPPHDKIEFEGKIPQPIHALLCWIWLSNLQIQDIIIIHCIRMEVMCVTEKTLLKVRVCQFRQVGENLIPYYRGTKPSQAKQSGSHNYYQNSFFIFHIYANSPNKNNLHNLQICANFMQILCKFPCFSVRGATYDTKKNSKETKVNAKLLFSNRIS